VQAGNAYSRPGVCAVTGASGYVGSRIASHLAGVGWEVRALCRSEPVGVDRALHVRFDLATGATPEMLSGVDALVHAGYDFSPTRWSEISRVNVEGSRRLLMAARDAGVNRIVYVSSVAAFPQARSMYGRAKLETERVALRLGAVVIRCGLVWGPQGAAMFGALRSAVELLPVVPLVAPAELELLLVCEHDLVVLVERVLAQWTQRPGRLFVAAAVPGLSFVELLRSFSEDGAGNIRVVPVPWRLAWLGLRSLEWLGIAPPFRSDSLLSLVSADPDPIARATAHAEQYGVSFRAYSPA
jgi:uncharacterized protein YbjT (DUF2867 family)